MPMDGLFSIVAPCDQPKEAGPCNGTFERWYFDKERDTCEPFLFGGCKGNKNNYPTESSCHYHCKKPGVHKRKYCYDCCSLCGCGMSMSLLVMVIVSLIVVLVYVLFLCPHQQNNKLHPTAKMKPKRSFYISI